MLDALTLDQIRTFVAVAESGSFRAGAGRLSRGQSGVSHAVANLEAALGVRLFDRVGYRPMLTPAGRALFEDARAVLLKVDAMRARARGLGEGVELSLSLVVDVLFPTTILGTALAQMREAYPSVGIRLRVLPLGGPLTALRNGDCTLAIMVGEDFRDPGIEVEALSSIPFVAVAASTHPLARPRPQDSPLRAVELTDHLQIVLEDPTPLTDGRDIGVLSPGTWRVGSQDTKYALILAGLGWGRLPLWLVESDLADNRLVRLKVAALGREGEVAMETYLAHRIDEPFGPAARTLRQSLLSCAGQPKPQERS